MMMPRWRHFRRQHAHPAPPAHRATFAEGSGQQSAGAHNPARELRLCLEDLGPLYAQFGLYLSSRLDLLPADYCRELAKTPDAAPSLQLELIHQILTRELRVLPEQVFSSFNPLPFRSSLLAQYHHATLRNGTQAQVIILRPEFDALRPGSPIANFSVQPFKHLCSQFSPEDPAYDFAASLLRRCEFKGTAQALKEIAADNPCPELLACSRIFPELSGSRILTLECPAGNPFTQPFENPATAHSLARRLCHTWLATAFFCEYIPVDPHPENVTVSADQQIVFTCSDYIQARAAAREDLWKYMVATMTDDPDTSAMYLLRQMDAPCRAVDVQEFRSSFRQSAYFAALEPLLGTNSNALAQLVFQHWKTALAHGYRPKPHLLDFYRGLFSIATIAATVSREKDFLQEAMEELRGMQLGQQFRTLVDFNRVAQNFDRFASAAVYFPRVLDDALTQIGRNNHSHVQLPPAPAHTQKTPLLVMAILMLAALLLLSQSHGFSLLSEKAALLLMALAGLLALRAVE